MALRLARPAGGERGAGTRGPRLRSRRPQRLPRPCGVLGGVPAPSSISAHRRSRTGSKLEIQHRTKWAGVTTIPMACTRACRRCQRNPRQAGRHACAASSHGGPSRGMGLGRTRGGVAERRGRGRPNRTAQLGSTLEGQGVTPHRGSGASRMRSPSRSRSPSLTGS